MAVVIYKLEQEELTLRLVTSPADSYLSDVWVENFRIGSVRRCTEGWLPLGGFVFRGEEPWDDYWPTQREAALALARAWFARLRIAVDRYEAQEHKRREGLRDGLVLLDEKRRQKWEREHNQPTDR